MRDCNKLLCPEVNVETKSTIVMNEGEKDKYTRVRGNTSPWGLKRGENMRHWYVVKKKDVGMRDWNRVQQDRQVTYDVTLRRVRATIFGVEKQYYIFWVCSFSFRYPACNAHVPYFHLWPARLYSMFPLINGPIFGRKKKLSKIIFFIFSTIFIWNISHSKKNWARYDCKLCWSSRKVPVILVRF